MLQLRDDSGRAIFSEPAESRFEFSTLPDYQTIGDEKQLFRLHNLSLTHDGRQYTASVGASLEDVETIMHGFRNLLLLMIPGVVAFSTFGGYWMSRRALRPVDEITHVAKSITVHNLSRRLFVPDSCDELQRMSEAWNDVLRRLDAAVQRIGQFTADASHELRTPIALIRATAELALKSERGSNQYKEALLLIESEAVRMTELTESLLTLARMDSNNIEMPLEQVDLNTIISDLIEDVQGMAAAHGVSLHKDTSAVAPDVLASEAAIRRLLLILIDNGVKYTPPGGDVRVSVRTAPGKVWVTIRDSGKGIAPEHLPHIFERFYRADTSRTGNEGAGLGLSIAQMMAEIHGTKIEVKSDLNVGSSFQFSLLEYSATSFTRFSDSSRIVEPVNTFREVRNNDDAQDYGSSDRGRNSNDDHRAQGRREDNQAIRLADVSRKNSCGTDQGCDC
jgi:heavy metal sensor kinase